MMNIANEMIVQYKTLHEKAEWLKCFIRHTADSFESSKSAHSKIEQMPRNSSWEDSFVKNLVEIGCDKQRVMNGLIHLLIEVLLRDLSKLQEGIEGEIHLLQNDIKKYESEESATVADLESKRVAHRNTLKSLEQDPWVTEFELKVSIQRYISFVKRKEHVLEKGQPVNQVPYMSFLEEYRRIFESFLDSLRSSYLRLADACSLVSEEKIEFCCEVDNNKGEADREKPNIPLFSVIFGEIMSSISKEMLGINVEVKRNLLVRKSMLCKLKCKGSWKLCFMVLTETEYLHFFDVPSLRTQYSEHKRLIDRLHSIHCDGIMSLIFQINERLTCEEEKELAILNGKVFKNLTRSTIIRSRSIHLTNKKTKINKPKSEILVLEDGSAQLFGLIQPKSTRIRSFLPSDIHDILLSLDRKGCLAEQFQTKAGGECKEHLKGDVQQGIKAGVGQMQFNDLEDENPWI